MASIWDTAAAVFSASRAATTMLAPAPAKTFGHSQTQAAVAAGDDGNLFFKTEQPVHVYHALSSVGFSFTVSQQVGRFMIFSSKPFQVPGRWVFDGLGIGFRVVIKDCHKWIFGRYSCDTPLPLERRPGVRANPSDSIAVDNCRQVPLMLIPADEQSLDNDRHPVIVNGRKLSHPIPSSCGQNPLRQEPDKTGQNADFRRTKPDSSQTNRYKISRMLTLKCPELSAFALVFQEARPVL